jgi:glutathione S-transferase
MQTSLLLSGHPCSPYTRKMLALLRYRRIPYRFVAEEKALAGLPVPKVRLMPTFYFPNQHGNLDAVTDSTPIIRRLEREHVDRAAVPTDHALAFIDALIEDYADEWLTKAMFHYRWYNPDDIQKASRVIPALVYGPISDERLAQSASEFSRRQTGRLFYVGSSPFTAPTIEASFLRLLQILERHLTTTPFILGDRPGACDFALFGQLSQLVILDPTPAALAANHAPRVVAWVYAMEDLSGLEASEAAWMTVTNLRSAVSELLGEIGSVYVPLIMANAAAVHEGKERVEVEIDGRPWVQAPFPYQAKCLQWLRQGYDSLDAEAKADVDSILLGTGCESLFVSA